ncbi:YibE/F family protein [Caldisalinibacter kiritimatiensis]|uniref:Membrane protein, putative n=1 Tax=Caldisalinibacter kiritimatiensis TaxID=1304284 RepID=R1ASJ6_9FIRM|nr:YibE/F family protein [Caldisalinibacter kiritimatiensis]EOD00128.1 membrane protein, putative [Caldisalinibacter kiritimatiensis]
MKIKILLISIALMLLVNSEYSMAVDSLQVTGEVMDVSIKKGDYVQEQLIKVKILEGKYKDKIVLVRHQILEYSLHNYELNTGDKVLISLSYDENNRLTPKLISVWRLEHLKNLSIIFLILLVIFGGLKGILSLTSLAISGFIIIKFIIPSILKGYDAITISVMGASVIIIVSFILISGFTKKSLAAIIGTTGGTFVAGLLSKIYSYRCHISGLADDDVMFLVTNIGLKINFKGLYMSAIIIGTIGVVMDVSMSVTSVIFEIKRKAPRAHFRELMGSGLKVGKDVMSTMVNTLILAYVGSFMPLLIIYITSDASFTYALNTELLSIEIIRSLSGSIGLILTIPLTCFVASIMAK